MHGHFSVVSSFGKELIAYTWKVKGQLDTTKLNFYYKTYYPLNMFRATLCPSSETQELYRWLLFVLRGSLVYRSLVRCGAVGFMCPGYGILLAI